MCKREKKKSSPLTHIYKLTPMNKVYVTIKLLKERGLERQCAIKAAGLEREEWGRKGEERMRPPVA